MVIQNISMEGAYAEAIEDAASRIHEAIRPQRIFPSSSISLSIISIGKTSSADIIVIDDKNDMVSSPPQCDNVNNSDEISALDGDNSTTSSDNYTDDDDLESNIFYLEEKKRILKKAKIQMEKEETYIAFNAHNMINGRDPSSRCARSSSIWSEAKAMIEEFRVVGVGISRNEEEEDSPPDLVSTSVSDVESRQSSSSHPAPDNCISFTPSLLPDISVDNTCQTRKRLRIDLSTVKQISSAEFSKECAKNEAEATGTKGWGDHICITGRSPIQQIYISPSERWQQASEMQLAIDSRNWISEHVLKQIFALTKAALSNHRRSIMTKGRGE